MRQVGLNHRLRESQSATKIKIANSLSKTGLGIDSSVQLMQTSMTSLHSKKQSQTNDEIVRSMYQSPSGGNLERSIIKQLSRDSLLAPGPGSYEQLNNTVLERSSKKINLKAMGKIFGSSSSISMHKSASQTSMIKLNKDRKPQSNECSPTTGPGDYIKTEKQLNLQTKTYNQGSMPRQARFNNSCVRGIIGKHGPGPAYLTKNMDIDSTKHAKPKINFSKQIRWDRRSQERASKLPSPASYIMP